MLTSNIDFLLVAVSGGEMVGRAESDHERDAVQPVTTEICKTSVCVISVNMVISNNSNINFEYQHWLTFSYW